MNNWTRPLSRFSITALVCLGGVAITASAAHAGKKSCNKRDHDHRGHDHRGHDHRGHDYDYDYDRRARDPVTTPVRFEPARRDAMRQCQQASRDQRRIFSERLAQLDRTEERTVRNAYLPRTRGKARGVAHTAREQARQLTTNDRSPWRSRALACRDDARRFRAATQTLERSIDKLMRLAARDARRARRFAPRRGSVYTAPRRRPINTAPRGPVNRTPSQRPVRVVYR